jgi:hypothetical protein
MDSIASGLPVTPSDPLDRAALAAFLGGGRTVAPEIPVHAPPAMPRGKRAHPDSPDLKVPLWRGVLRVMAKRIGAR